jgi:hypothetical protein
VFLLQLIVVCLGKFLDSFSQEIACSEDGCMWIYTGAKGNLFIALHIIGAMMASGVARAVFIKTAKAHGIFADIEEDEVEDRKD